MKTLEIRSFESPWLDAAVGLFIASYRQLRNTQPLLPRRYEQADVVRPLLTPLVQQHPAVMALAEGRVVGYLAGFEVPELKGRDNGVYCPEWGHAVAPEAPPAERRWVYRKLYEAIGETWVRRGLLNHALTLLAHDTDALDTWFWNTFGLLCVDVIRGIEPVPVPAEVRERGLRVRLATPADVPALFPVFAEHEVYYHRSPIFLPKAPMADDSELAGLIASPNEFIWLAEENDGRVVGLMKGTLGNGDACLVVRDDDTLACTGMYVLPAARRRGVGTLLLDAFVSWAREHGCTRVSLDFEAANLYGSRFWLTHFSPVCHSLFRHVNDHILTGQPRE